MSDARYGMQEPYNVRKRARQEDEQEWREKERAAVVRYLRACGYGSGSKADKYADEIEKGEHLK